MSVHAAFPPQSARYTAVGPPGGLVGIVMHLQHTWHQPNIYDYKTLRIDTSGWGMKFGSLFRKVWISCFQGL